MRGGAPEVMKSFSALARAALDGTALDAKTKELIALGISVAVRCDACVALMTSHTSRCDSMGVLATMV